MNILRKAFKIFNGSSWDEYHLKTDSKNDLTNGGYQMHFYTINTNYSDRVEALKDSLKNRPDMFAVGVNIVYVISSNDDRGVGIIIKKNDSRCAFKYFDYWGANQFWTLTSAGWEKKA